MSSRSYWASMTPEQRSAEMRRRMSISRKRAKREAATTESPFPAESLVGSLTQPRRTVRALITDLSGILDELKQMFGD